MKLFISKSEQDLGELSAFCQLYGIEFQAQSLIDTSPIPFTLPEKFDAIFFASPRAVDYFLTNEAIPSGVKVACAGDQTRKRLLQNGLTPDFVSSKSAHPEHSAKDFKQFLNDRTCYFPSSNISLNSYSALIPEKQKIIQAIYTTSEKATPLDSFDISIFTSPSNVRSFFAANTLKANSIVISWGDSTTQALLSFGVPEIKQLDESSISALIECLTGLQ